MKKFICLLLSLVLTVSCIFAGFGYTIPVGSDFYEKVDRLFILNGQALPSGTRPWSVDEAYNELRKLDMDSLSGSDYLVALHEQVTTYLKDLEGTYVNVELEVSPELYAHTNSAFDQESLWLNNFLTRRPLLLAQLDVLSKGFSFHTELDYRAGRVCTSDVIGTVQDLCAPLVDLEYFPIANFMNRPYPVHSNRYGALLSSNIVSMADCGLPMFAWLSYSWENGSVGMYRAKKEWGKTSIGNYIYDKHMSAYDYVTAKIFNPKFNFDFTIMFPDSYLGGSANSYAIEYQRLFLSHRFQFTPNQKLSIALSENVMYWLNSGLEFSLLNPAYIYHSNIENNLFNAIAHVELEYTPIRGLRIYSQLGVDQGSVPFFEDASTEDQAMGFTLGSQYYFASFGGVSDVNVEFAYVTPAMYRRGSQHPDFILADLTVVNDDSYTMIPVLTYLGFPYGGDTFTIKAGYDFWADRFSVETYAMLLGKGELTLFTPKTSRTGWGLTGDVSLTYMLDAKVSFQPDWKGMLGYEFFTELGFVYCNRYGADVQLSVGFSVGLDKAFLRY